MVHGGEANYMLLHQPGGGVGLARALGFIRTPANLFLVSLTTLVAVETS
jgi:hypothetical protein